MLSNGLCLRTAVQYMTVFSNGSIIPLSFKFTELHAVYNQLFYVVVESANVCQVLEFHEFVCYICVVSSKISYCYGGVHGRR